MKKRLASLFRASEWWQYKLSPLLAVCYILFYQHQAAISHQGWLLFSLLIYCMLAAATVSMLNHFADQKTDRLAQKSNPFLLLPQWMQLPLLGIVVLVQALVYWRLESYPMAYLFYFAALGSFILYSFPPLRLKEKAVWSLLADALGSHVFSSLFVVCYTVEKMQWSLDPKLIFVLIVWSLPYGIRGILWHQYTDRKADAASGIRNLVHLYSMKQLKQLNILLLSIELVGLCLLLLKIGSWWPVVGLAAYMTVAGIRHFRCKIRFIISMPVFDRWQLFLFGYYERYLPIAVLIGICFYDPWALWVLVVHGFIINIQCN